MSSKSQPSDQTEAPVARRARLIPLIQRAVPGLLAAWPIFGDVHPALVLAEPEVGTDDRGREGTIIRLLVQRTNLKGEVFTKTQKVLEQFVFQRPEGMVGALIDGRTIDQAIAEHADRFGDFLDQQQASASVYAGETPEA